MKKGDRCTTSVQNQINNGQPILEFRTVTVPAGLTTIGVDLPVAFTAPHKFFMIVSIAGPVSDAFVAISFTKQNFNTGGTTQIIPTGGEQWIPFSNKSNSAGRCEGRYIRFEIPVQTFFLTADHPTNNPVAGQYFLTILGTDDIEAVISERV
jgi:hypothetical protein